jgi:hypothetical protein
MNSGSVSQFEGAGFAVVPDIFMGMKSVRFRVSWYSWEPRMPVRGASSMSRGV